MTLTEQEKESIQKKAYRLEFGKDPIIEGTGYEWSEEDEHEWQEEVKKCQEFRKNAKYAFPTK